MYRKNDSKGQHSLDSFQSAAVSIRKNAVVAAGAGSGKTTVLARRYLELVKEGAEVGSILTLTFTRKAAAEMYDRIRSLLASEVADPAVAKAVESFEESYISTLDSFCLQIARESTGRFGFPSDFTIDEYRVGEICREQAISFTASRAGDSVLKSFVRSNGYDSVVDEFFVPIAMNYLTIGEPHDFHSMYAKQISSLKSDLSAKCVEIESIVEQISRVDREAGKNVSTIQDLLTTLEQLTRRLETEEYEQLVDELGGAKPKRPPSNAKHPEIRRLRGLVEKFLDFRELILPMADTMIDRDLIRGVMELLSEFQDRVMESRRDLGVCTYSDVASMAVVTLRDDLDVRRYYRNRFSFIMIDEFQDNNSIQRDLLFLLASAPGDTNPGVVPSSDEISRDKLFFVGDQKQSIYRFRGAEVSVFKQLSDNLASVGGTTLSLPVNYRSSPELIAFFNLVFAEIMSDADKPYEAKYEPLESGSEPVDESVEPKWREGFLDFTGDDERGDQPRVEERSSERVDGFGESVTDTATGNGSVSILFKPFVADRNPEHAHSDDAEAVEIAKRIDLIVGSESIPDGTGESRLIEHGDIALVMRSTSNQIKYERALRNRGIPYTVDSARSLFIESIFNDMYSLLQIVVYPDDRTAYMAFLRSPFCGLSDNGVVRLLIDGVVGRCFEHTEEAMAGLSDTDLIHYGKAENLYREMATKIQTGTIRDAIGYLWYECGYRYQILTKFEYHTYLEHFDYLVALADESASRGQNVVTFLRFMRENLGQYERLPDLEILKPDRGGVRIMTVHKSKGLEFPIVFFANTGNRGMDGESSLPFYLSDDLGLTVNVKRGDHRNVFYLRGKDETDAKELAELKRLAYVACTRAQYRLYVSGVHNVGNRNIETHLNMILAALGWDRSVPPESDPVLEDWLELIPDVPEYALYRPSSGGIESRRLGVDVDSAKRIYAGANIVSYPEPKRREWTVTEAASLVTDRVDPTIEVESEPDSQILRTDLDIEIEKDGNEAQFGTLCHAILARLVCDAASVKSSEFDKVSLESAVRTALFAFDDSQRSSIEDYALELCQRSFDSEIAPLLVGAEAEIEMPFTLAVESDVLVRGHIDCVLRYQKSVIMLDYKTDIGIVPNEYRPQLLLYRMAVERWLEQANETGKLDRGGDAESDKPIRGYLVYLRYNRTIEVDCYREITFPWQTEEADG